MSKELGLNKLLRLRRKKNVGLSDLKELLKESYWFEKKKVITSKIRCDYVSLKCNSKRTLDLIVKIYEVYCNSCNGKLKYCYNYYPKLIERENRFSKVEFYVILKKESHSKNWLLHFPGPQANELVTRILFDECFRLFCFSKKMKLCRLDSKWILKEENFYTNVENHIQLQELLAKRLFRSEGGPISERSEDVNYSEKELSISVTNSSSEYFDLVSKKYVSKKGTTTYIEDYKYKRRIYTYILEREVHFELEQKKKVAFLSF